MKKTILSIGLIATMAMSTTAISAEDKEDKAGQGWTIGGISLSNPFAKSGVTNPLADIDFPTKIAGVTVSNPLELIKIPEGLKEAFKDVRFGNPLDKSTWWDGADHVNHKPGETMAFNFADPAFWMSIPNPKTHSTMHGAITNPANWGQFLQADSYRNMVDPQILSKWLEVKSYDVMLDPQTYAYWMQPGAYQHLLNKDHYTQLLNGSAYSALANTALGNVGLSFAAPADKWSLQGWINSVSKSSADEAKI